MPTSTTTDSGAPEIPEIPLVIPDNNIDMNKVELITKIEAKVGFVSIIKDELAPDHVVNDPIEKRFLYVNHVNADGTMGKKFVYYLLNTETDEAGFYNVEEELDSKELPANVKALKALEAYLAGKYEAYFVLRYDLEQKVAEADVFELNADKSALASKKILAYQKGTDPIKDIDIV